MLKCLHGVGKLRIGGRILIRKNPAHAAHHVVQDMAVEKPVAARFLRSVKLNHLGVHGLDIRCKLERRKIPMPVHQPEKCPCRCMGCLIMVLLVRIMRTFCPSLIMIRSVSERVFPLMLHT